MCSCRKVATRWMPAAPRANPSSLFHQAMLPAAWQRLVRWLGVFPESRHWPMAAATALGATRVLKGAHWPLDLLAGAVIGLAAEAATSSLLRLLFSRK